MAELPVRPDPVRDVAIATRGAVGESLSYRLPAIFAALAVSTATFVALGPANTRRTSTFPMRGLTDHVERVRTASDPARSVNLISARSERGDAIDVVYCRGGSGLATLGVGVTAASVALSATVIEKHFAHSGADGGVDAAFSLEPGVMRALVDETLREWQGLGAASFGAGEAESGSKVFRRSLREPVTSGVPAQRGLV
jgi:hypothetical protein